MACVFLYWIKPKEHEHRFSHDTLASAIDDFFWRVEKNSTRQVWPAMSNLAQPQLRIHRFRSVFVSA
jgi:hypothetical protein